MSDKSQPSRSTSNVAPSHRKMPYKALLIRAQSPEPSKVNSTDGGATGSQMRSRKNAATKKAPYKALLIRARSPEPTVKPRKNKTARKGPTTSQEPEAGITTEEQNKKRRISKKKNAREGTMSKESEVKETVTKKTSTEEP